ncbi:MAG: hypothetical protein ACI9R3_000268 [Verrucomicrobiales bacterium]|jgi:hypothetical protein
MIRLFFLLSISAFLLPPFVLAGEEPIDFNRDIRPILSNACFRCHGPDAEERKGGTRDSGGLRLDAQDAAMSDLGGYAAIVPGNHSVSEMIKRIVTSDADELMPPPEGGEALSEHQVALLKRWIDEGAQYARHWAYVPPTDAAPPEVNTPGWTRNAIDHFILQRLEAEGMTPMPEADRYALIRRVALDLTGLPPAPEEVEAFVNDGSTNAYEMMVDSMLQKKSFGEHWARNWLDLARYADSAGYADDPSRTIWAYRDYVIKAFNDNKPFDTFTIEQLAGDLLPDPTQEQLIATAFHRNTQTNNEGGTSDEEFRNVAVVDRVNTTLAVWMGTTMACAQCHTHKYDPITHQEYFEVFAIFNNSADADRRDESPLIDVITPEFEREKAAKSLEISQLREKLNQPTAAQQQAFTQWQKTALAAQAEWKPLQPTSLQAESGATFNILDDQSILVSGTEAETDTYTITTTAETGSISAFRIEALPDPSFGGGNGPGRKGNFVLNEFEITEAPQLPSPLPGRFVRIDLKGSGKMIHLAEVEVFNGDTNLARKGTATQSSTYASAKAELAIDGNTDGDFFGSKSVSHTAANATDPWWEVDLGSESAIERIAIWNRTDNDLATRLDGFTLTLLDDDRKPVWTETFAKAPEKSSTTTLSGPRSIRLQNATATFSQDKFGIGLAIDGDDGGHSGWAVGGQTGKAHAAVFETAALTTPDAGATLTFTLKQSYGEHALGRFRLSSTTAPQPVRQLPSTVIAALAKSADSRAQQESADLLSYFAQIDPSLQNFNKKIAQLEKQLAEMKPPTTVPVMRDLPESKHRQAHIQIRGNYLDKGEEVQPGLPGGLHSTEKITGEPDRLALAQWLIDPDNPLTGRVTANRFWESIFGIGLVRTSEEFGSQGEPPTHPQLLDWMANELVRSKWDTKQFLKLLVMSATYRQSSRVTPEMLEIDPENRLLARGPRFRISAEMVRDQSLFAAGLLSSKIYGPPVRPQQPQSGLSAAFGGGIDWKTSSGEDKYRRGIYTTWRRSNPYPSMTTFDAPNREVCIIRRDRTNTPLQALVTLNDPVYMEAAQALARRLLALQKPVDETIDAAYMICLARHASDAEKASIKDLLQRTQKRLAEVPDQAMQLATTPLGPAPEGADITELAAWSVVSNVLLNLDEFFLKR